MDMNDKPTENLSEEVTPSENQPASGTEQAAPQPGKEQCPQMPNTWAAAGPPPKEIRVGRVTLGLALIAVGILLLIGLFNPNFSIIAAAKCAPVILIFIGAEILITTFFAKGKKIKYDFLSMFVCFLLIAGSFVMAMIPAVYQNVVVRERVEERLSDQIEEDCYYAAESEGIAEVDCRIYLSAGLNDEIREDMTYSEVGNLLAGQYLTVRLDENFDTAEAFCQKARKVLDLLKPLDLPDADISIVQQNHEGYLDISAGYQWDFSADKLENLCSGWEGNSISAQWEEGSSEEIELSFDE